MQKLLPESTFCVVHTHRVSSQSCLSIFNQIPKLHVAQSHGYICFVVLERILKARTTKAHMALIQRKLIFWKLQSMSDSGGAKGS